MKFVYVLVSGPEDFYTEQAFLSMVSLRKNNPDAYIVMITDKGTKKNLTRLRSHLLHPLDELVEIEVPEVLNNKCKSRYLKTLLRNLIKGNFLYVDTDTVIRDNLRSLENFECHIAAAYDRNENGEGNEFMNERFHKIGEEDLNNYIFFNSGVLLVKDSPESYKFFNDWHSIWWEGYNQYGVEIDQVSFLKANLKNGNLIKELPGEFNCQLPFHNSIDYLIQSRIIHYITDYKSIKEFPFENIDFLNKVREKGVVKEVEEILDKPVEKFLKFNIMLGKKETAIYSSPLVVLARKISRDFPFSNKIASIIYKLFGYNIK